MILSLLVVVPAAFLYGASPAEYMPSLFDFEVETTDLKNVFRAIMGLYLAFSVVWILGILKSTYWRAATLLNLIFMAGLAIGRALSMVLDGIPSAPFAYGVIGEFVLALFAAYQLRRYG